MLIVLLPQANISLGT